MVRTSAGTLSSSRQPARRYTAGWQSRFGPGSEIAGTRALRWGHDTLTAELRYIGLYDDDLGGVENPDKRTWVNGPMVWVVCVIERRDADGIVAPPITWADALVKAVDRAYNLSFADIYPPGATLGWLDTYDKTKEVCTRYAPDIQVVDA